MDRLIITGVSSIQCADAGALRDAVPSRSQSVARCRPASEYLAGAVHLPIGCTYPVELLSDMNAPRHNSKQWITRRVCGALPPNSMLRLEDDLYITSPEFYFLRRARQLSVAHACQLAMELCGGYSTLYSMPYRHFVEERLREDPSVSLPLFPPDEWGLGLQQAYDLMANGYVNRPPLTSVSRLKRYLGNIYGQSLRPIARKAVGLIQDGSRSPGETRMFMLTCLPGRYGGARLALPVLNKRIELTDCAAGLTRASHFKADMCWSTAKVIAEYDGRVHNGDAHRVHDDERRLALAAMGYQVFVLDHESLKDPLKVDAFVATVAKAIGQRIYPLRNPQQFELKRRALQRSIFDYDFDLYRSREGR